VASYRPSPPEGRPAPSVALERRFRQIGEIWLERARQLTSDVVVDGVNGTILGLDESGNLLVKPSEGRATSLPILVHATRGGEGIAA